MKLVEYPDRDLLMLALADQIAGELGDFLRREGRASFCVPGGTTPGPIFDTLSGVDLDWENVSVFLNDERWVNEESPRSNTRLLRERLLRGKALNAKLVPLYAATDVPESSKGHRPSGRKRSTSAHASTTPATTAAVRARTRVHRTRHQARDRLSRDCRTGSRTGLTTPPPPDAPAAPSDFLLPVSAPGARFRTATIPGPARAAPLP